MLKKFLGVFFFLCLFSNLAFAAYLVGTKDLNYGFRFPADWDDQVYALKDISGNILEYGASFRSPGWSLGIAYSRKDNLLDNSLLLRSRWNGGFPFLGQQWKGHIMLGLASLRSVFSTWTSYEASPTNAFNLGGDCSFIHRWGERWSFCLGAAGQYFFRPGATGNDASDIAFLGYMLQYNNLSYTAPFIFGTQAALKYDLEIRWAHGLPFNLLYNQGPAVVVENPYFSLAGYYPLQEMYLREKYPYQNKRVELGLNLPLGNEVSFFGKLVQQESASTYNAMLSRPILADTSAGIFMAKDFSDQRLGLQITCGENVFAALGNTYEHREERPRGDTSVIQSISLSPEPSVNVPTLDDLIPILNTPDKVSWYAWKKIAYSYDHNGFSGMFGLYTPQEVFSKQKGNCLETSALQSYLLRRNGYETALVEFAGRATPHGLCLYKDPATGKWNAVENNVTSYPAPYLYNTQADNYADILNKIYPGWFSYLIKDQDQKAVVQVDSTTKWYLNDWFDQE